MVLYGGLMEKKLKGAVRTAKTRYKKTTYVESPAFANEKVYFRDSGFNHLIRKGKRLRSEKEIIRRLHLLHHVTHIVKSAGKYTEYREIIKERPGNTQSISVARFWSLVHIVQGKEIRVIIRQINKEPKHFFSVMDEN